MLFPMHVVILELIIDPVCAMVFEAEPGGAKAMQESPRKRDEALFGRDQLGLALLQGFGILAGVLGVYVWSLGHASEAEARGGAFLGIGGREPDPGLDGRLDRRAARSSPLTIGSTGSSPPSRALS